MPELVADCPRCGAIAHTFIVHSIIPTHKQYDWQNHYEAFCLCKHCLRNTIFQVSQKRYEDKNIFAVPSNISSYELSLNHILDVEGFISLRNMATQPAPEYTPTEIEKVYKEGAESVVGNCPNAAVAMFRLCIDLATKSFLPSTDTENIPKNVRDKLKTRLAWLFETERLPKGLEDLSDCIREDGNDGAHDGTITSEEAEDIMEFCSLLLQRLYTEPAKLEIATKRRLARREAS